MRKSSRNKKTTDKFSYNHLMDFQKQKVYRETASKQENAKKRKQNERNRKIKKNKPETKKKPKK